MKKVFITGITGFAGSHLADLLNSSGEYEVAGTYLNDESLSVVDHIKDKISLVKLDLLDKDRVFEIFSHQSFDTLFHLAAFSAPSRSFENPTLILSNNIIGTTNLLEAFKTYASKAKMLLVSSAEVYGKVDKNDLPIDEDTPLRPINPYAISKLTQDLLGYSYYFSYGLDIVRVRPFNHIGPRQSPFFVIPSFCKQIAEIEKGKREAVIKVGNLDSIRDFTDVRDMVRAYLLLSDKGVAGELYNAGSGVSHKISDVLLKLLSYSKVEIKIDNDKDLLRPAEVSEIVCDSSRLKSLTGWSGNIPFEQSLSDTLDYWREIV